LAAARLIAERQQAEIARAARVVTRRLSGPPSTVILSGQGEFLARRVISQLRLGAEIVSLAERLGPAASTAATAHALARLAADRPEERRS
jgi:uncharacterized hydantoinase/oxoprolinase family protein